ncbi:MAG: hypothetical protein JSR55_05350 [Proteobacteria bacterium]|nr:hypothetical protein [Pseudomonadota bacterium]
MRFSPIVPAALATALFAAAPALAQQNPMSGNAMSHSNATATGSSAMSNHMSGAANTNMTCQAMMTKANAMTQPTDLTKKSAAQKDMSEAKSAMAAGNESACKMHVQAAMKNML